MECSEDDAIRVATSMLHLPPDVGKRQARAQFSNISFARNRLRTLGEHNDQIPVAGNRVRARIGTLVQSLAEGVK
jgi:hypothetical protein